MDKIEKSAKKVIETFENGKYYTLGTTEDHHSLLQLRDQLQQQYISLQDFLSLKDDEGRGFFHNDSRNTFIWVNGVYDNNRECDQLRVLSIEKGFKPRQCFERVAELIENID